MTVYFTSFGEPQHSPPAQGKRFLGKGRILVVLRSGYLVLFRCCKRAVREIYFTSMLTLDDLEQSGKIIKAETEPIKKRLDAQEKRFDTLEAKIDKVQETIDIVQNVMVEH